MFSLRRLTIHSFYKKAVMSIRCCGLTEVPSNSTFIHMTELTKNGETTESAYTLDELMVMLKKNEFNLPPRDMKMFFRSSLESTNSNSILARPWSNCFLLELEQLKLICFSEKCIILHPDNKVVKGFVKDLVRNCSDPVLFEGLEIENKQTTRTLQFQKLLTSNIKDMHFEHVVLEQSLSNITSRFSRHIWMTKPALEMLLLKITQHPSGSMLRRLLAFRKSLGEFELNVIQVNSVVEELLKNDEDMVALYLTSSLREIHQHHNVEQLLEAYNQNLSEILAEIKSMKSTVDETNQFIDTHLSSVRNRMIRMSLFMEMGTLSLAVGAFAAGTFGMNLLHGMEEHPQAFYIATVGMISLMATLYGSIIARYYRVVADTTQAHSFKALKNFFQYVDELEMIIEEKGKERFTPGEFKEVLNKLTGTIVTDEESEFIFKMFDSDQDGVLVKKEILLGEVNKFKNTQSQ